MCENSFFTCFSHHTLYLRLGFTSRDRMLYSPSAITVPSTRHPLSGRIELDLVGGMNSNTRSFIRIGKTRFARKWVGGVSLAAHFIPSANVTRRRGAARRCTDEERCFPDVPGRSSACCGMNTYKAVPKLAPGRYNAS